MNLPHKPPLWFWILSALLLVWNLLGVMAYVQEATMTAEALQAMPAAERALLLARPAWATAAFAFAVFGGASGGLLLLLRTRIAIAVLVLSSLGVVVQMTHAFAIADSIAVYGPSGLIMPALVLTISILLIVFALHARKRSWLR
jgi:hypothetical protein